jgi:Domain of unknown function (DUF4304)
MSAASLIARLDRELTPRGFSRKKATWNREQGSLVEVIDIQTSKGGDAVTMSAGVLSRPNYFACWGRDAEPFIEEPFCTVRARVGQLIDNRDRWWDVSSAGVAEELVDCLAARIFPFLERMQSLEGMRDWLTSTGVPSPISPLPSICFAVLQAQLGDVGAACTVLAELERKALGVWKARAKEVASRVGCAVDPTR